jgi:2-dehydro-3-deoxygluconokinase
MARVVTFGEIMLRLSPPGFERFFQSPTLSATFGGGEANVAVSLAQLGCDSHYVTRLPKHEVGEAAIKALRAEGVHVDHILRGGDRVGIYFAETGASQRSSLVIYDRAHSALAELEPRELDWAKIFDGASWFHCTGITPALGPKPRQCVEDALRSAKERGIRVSFDLNFRKKLWTEAEAQRVMRPLMQFIDVVIANEEDVQAVLGIAPAGVDVTRGALNVDAYRELADRVATQFGTEVVAITLRESISASVNGWRAVLRDAAGDFFQSRHYQLSVVDRIGAGDSFGAGLIYALLAGKASQAALEFAVAASALKHSIPGDYNRVSVAEIDRLVLGDGSGRVQR